MQAVNQLFLLGVDRVILGTAALEDRAFLTEALAKFGSKIIVGIDAKDGKVATRGWTDASDVLAISFAQEMYKLGVQYIIYTDISRDGTLTEPNYQALGEIVRAFGGRVIASGGLSDISQLTKLRELGAQGAIIGKAIYSGRISVSDAVSI
jgi:phosphoribosylformimino-5-aminoimidazole carboxamide ribotide isomerase